MNRWLMGSLAGVFAGVGAYLMVSQTETPQPLGNVLEPPTIVAPPPSPPAPIVLSQVIETTDLDPLLDPPAKLLTGVPFDTETVSTPLPVPAAPPVPDRIPPAVEDLPKENELSGYQLGTDALYDSNIHSVFVHAFYNRTLETGPFRGFEVSATAEVVRQIGYKTPFHVVSDATTADTELICNIVSIQKNILNATSQNATREGEVIVSMDVVWRDLSNGKILSAPKKPGGTPQEKSRADQIAKQPAEKASTPRTEPVRIVASGRYIMELGETVATAAQRAEIELATKIVSMTEKQR